MYRPRRDVLTVLIDAVLDAWDLKDDPAKFEQKVSDAIEKDREMQQFIQKAKSKEK